MAARRRRLLAGYGNSAGRPHRHPHRDQIPVPAPARRDAAHRLAHQRLGHRPYRRRLYHHPGHRRDRLAHPPRRYYLYKGFFGANRYESRYYYGLVIQIDLEPGAWDL